MKKIIFILVLVPAVSFAAVNKSYNAFVKSFFAVTDVSKVAPSVSYVGKDENGKRCQVTAYYDGQNDIGYTDVRVNVTNGGDDDELAEILIQGDAVDMQDTGDATTVYSSKSTTCGEIYKMTVEFNSPKQKTVYNMKSISTSSSSNSCHSDNPYTTRERTCNDLQKQADIDTALVKVATKLTKAAVDAEDAKRITDKRNINCAMTPDSELMCSWDISDDMDGDSGDVVNSYIQIKNGKAVKVVKLTRTDKYTGDESAY